MLACSVIVFAIAFSFIPETYSLTMEKVIANHIVAVDFTLIAKLVLIPSVLVLLKRTIDAGWKLTTLKFLGKISFGLFFWHVYVINIVKEIFSFYFQSLDNEQGLLVYVSMILQFSAVLGILGFVLPLVRKSFGPKSVFLTG